MSFDRREFSQLITKHQAEISRTRQPDLVQLRQAAVSVENMTGTPEWDVFLSYLQAGVDATIKQRDAYRRDLDSPLLVNADAVAQKRIAVIRLNDRIDTLQRVISMPAEIRKTGQVAAERLKELTKLDEEAA